MGRIASNAHVEDGMHRMRDMEDVAESMARMKERKVNRKPCRSLTTPVG
jgi:hypothetical protein